MQNHTRARIAWANNTRRFFLFVGMITVAYGLLRGCLYVVPGYGRWQRDGDAVTSPSQRHAVTPIVILYPNLNFGLLISDLETGKDEVCAGWTGDGMWCREIRWIDEDRLRVEYYAPNSLH